VLDGNGTPGGLSEQKWQKSFTCLRRKKRFFCICNYWW